MEHRGGHGGDEDGEVEPQGPEHQQHGHQRQQVRPAEDIAEAFHQAAGLARRPAVPVQLVRSHGPQRDQHREEGDGVEDEHPARAHRSDQQPRDRRSDQPRGVERGRVQADRVGQVLLPDHFGHESLAGRRVEGRRAAEQEGEHVDLPSAHHACERQQAETQRQQPHGRLGGQQELAPVQMVPPRTRSRAAAAPGARTAAPPPRRRPRRHGGSAGSAPASPGRCAASRRRRLKPARLPTRPGNCSCAAPGKPRRRVGSRPAIAEQADDLIGGRPLPDAREDALQAVGVNLSIDVGHGVYGEHHVEA